MVFKEPSYKEFKKATSFARIRYKYGLIVNLIAILCLIILIIFVYTYKEELSNNPLIYAAREIGANSCICYNPDTKTQYIFNQTSVFIKKNIGS